MKPLGTITMYFPFVNDEDRAVLENLMGSAHNYVDFVERLIDRVCSEPSSQDLVFVASLHIINTPLVAKLWDRLIESYRDMKELRPSYIIQRITMENPHPGEKIEDDLRRTIAEVIDSRPSDLITYIMYNWERYKAYTSGSASGEEAALIKMNDLMRLNPDLECFKPLILVALAHQESAEKPHEALDQYENALELAIKYDDQRYISVLLLDIAYTLRNSDTKRAVELLEQSWTLRERLGFKKKSWGFLNMEGAVRNARGEFDTAVECYLEAIDQMQSAHPYHSLRYLPSNIAFVYNEMGDGEEALEWGKMALESMPGSEVALAFANQHIARALIHLDRLSEASEFLDKGRELALKTGSERCLLDSYLASGLLERAQGDFETANHSFERSLEISERMLLQNRINSSLLRLTESEVQQYDAATSDYFAENSGPWMTRLEKMVHEKDLPGILGLTLLLKAELRLKQERFRDSFDILDEVKRLSSEHGLEFLKEKAASLSQYVD